LIRSFLAIELPRTIQEKIEEIQEDLKSTHADVRWVSPEKIHLTLKFFGNIEESKIEPIVKSIEGSIQATPPFSLKAKGMGAFPYLKNPRVIWMGLTDGKEKVISLQQRLEGLLEKIGFKAEDRSFQPHLTLGRVKTSRGREELARGIEKYRDAHFGDFHVETILFLESDLRPSGPIYTPLKEMKLGGS